MNSHDKTNYILRQGGYNKQFGQVADENFTNENVDISPRNCHKICLNQCKWKACKSVMWSFCIFWCFCRQFNSRATVCLYKGHACSFDSDCIILSKCIGVNLNEFGTHWTDLTSEFWFACIRSGYNHTRYDCQNEKRKKIHI